MIISRYQPSLYILRNSDIFVRLEQDVFENLASRGNLLHFQAKRSADSEYELGNKVYVLVEGKAFLSCIGSDGKKIILEELEEGSIFGDLDFFANEGGNECFFIEPFPKSSIKVYEFKKEVFLEFLLKNPALALKVLSAVSKRVERLESKIEEQTFLSLKTRLLAELVRLGQATGKGKQVKVKYKITHEKLAEAVGAVRETVSKTLAELKREGLISYDRRKAIIVHLGRKKKIREGSWPILRT